MMRPERGMPLALWSVSSLWTCSRTAARETGLFGRRGSAKLSMMSGAAMGEGEHASQLRDHQAKEKAASEVILLAFNIDILMFTRH